MLSARESFRRGRLTASPKTTVQTFEFKTGIQPLRLDFTRDGMVYIPTSYTHKQPCPLVVMLHGAGGAAEHGLNLLMQYADDQHLLLLAPASRVNTWDVIVKNTFNSDVIFIDEALSLVFERYNIDVKHIAIGGFSDGASYALSLGLSNGDLFTHIIAFSPGFYHTIENKGYPNIFISHGVKDKILPIAPCSRRIVPRLKRLRHNIRYEEFQGEHEIPQDVSVAAINWFLKS
ncbi:MAG: alpha/beta hydrolase-fold protein [Bacteroidota bacterium]|nr:alpha/beta hydrolase-fold protein [Bacteroidota bacterium]